MDIIKVSGNSRPTSVAGAIAGVVRETLRAEVQAIGPWAVNQAVKAVAIARGYLAQDGIDVVCMPEFTEVDIEGETRTAIRIVVDPRREEEVPPEYPTGAKPPSERKPRRERPPAAPEPEAPAAPAPAMEPPAAEPAGPAMAGPPPREPEPLEEEPTAAEIVEEEDEKKDLTVLAPDEEGMDDEMDEDMNMQEMEDEDEEEEEMEEMEAMEEPDDEDWDDDEDDDEDDDDWEDEDEDMD